MALAMLRSSNEPSAVKEIFMAHRVHLALLSSLLLAGAIAQLAVPASAHSGTSNECGGSDALTQSYTSHPHQGSGTIFNKENFTEGSVSDGMDDFFDRAIDEGRFGSSDVDRRISQEGRQQFVICHGPNLSPGDIGFRKFYEAYGGEKYWTAVKMKIQGGSNDYFKGRVTIAFSRGDSAPEKECNGRLHVTDSDITTLQWVHVSLGTTTGSSNGLCKAPDDLNSQGNGMVAVKVRANAEKGGDTSNPDDSHGSGIVVIDKVRFVRCESADYNVTDCSDNGAF
jgi:hypothetical protein